MLRRKVMAGLPGTEQRGFGPLAGVAQVEKNAASFRTTQRGRNHGS